MTSPHARLPTCSLGVVGSRAVSVWCQQTNTSTSSQVYEAYRNGKVEEAMSFGFLLFLFSGDLSSLIGCVLTSQLPIQIVTVVFYIFTDLLLISQFLYYKIKNNSSKSNQRCSLYCSWCAIVYSSLCTH
uniref:Uncharacterized protein n=1 Tax=Oncorhynchus tshawytscha TaxID=74940 RepID=A0A8C8ITT5_ONCTS